MQNKLTRLACSVMICMMHYLRRMVLTSGKFGSPKVENTKSGILQVDGIPDPRSISVKFAEHFEL